MTRTENLRDLLTSEMKTWRVAISVTGLLLEGSGESKACLQAPPSSPLPRLPLRLPFFFRPHRFFFLFPPVQCLVPDYPLMQEHFLWPLLKRKVLHWGWISVCGCFNLSFKFLLDLDKWERFSFVRECDGFLQRVLLRWAQLTDLQIQV